MKKYKILTIPSSDNEEDFDNIDNFDDALKFLKTVEDRCGANVFEFETAAEMKAFIKGYEHGIGYLGQGLYYKKIEE